MTTDEAIARIQRKLGYRTDKSDEILEELQDAQQRLERGIPSPQGGGGTYLPFFLTTEAATALTISGDERLALPTDFVGEIENCLLYRYDPDADPDAQWQPLAKDDEAFLKAKYPLDGKPLAYYLSGSYFRFRPVPDDEYTIKLIYGGQDTTLTAGAGTNKWLTYAPWLLLGSAGMSLAQSLRDTTAFGFFQQQFVADNMAIFQQTIAREVTNDRPIMGGEN